MGQIEMHASVGGGWSQFAGLPQAGSRLLRLMVYLAALAVSCVENCPFRGHRTQVHSCFLLTWSSVGDETDEP
jgi:hypothetical protein